MFVKNLKRPISIFLDLVHDWDAMVQVIQEQVKSLNFGYRTTLRDQKVKYINNFGKLIDPHTVEVSTSE